MTTTIDPETAFGYLSIVHSPEHGYFGGYLIVSEFGRPLEFHCTSPVRPNRAQEILYGATLQPYLVGEQIGGTLLATAKLTPLLVLTDHAAMLDARTQAGVPIVYIVPQCDELIGQRAGIAIMEADAAKPRPLAPGRFTFGSYTFRLPLRSESDDPAIVELLALLSRNVDLGEPFGRIHEAIREAQRIGDRMSEGHAQAA